MSLLVVGSVALDSVETPFGKREDVLGGSGTYFAAAASLFTGVSVVGVVGEDFLSRTSTSCAGVASTSMAWRARREGLSAGGAGTDSI